jgi:hypothetical protein
MLRPKAAYVKIQRNDEIPVWRGLKAEASDGKAGVDGMVWTEPSNHSHHLLHGADISTNPIFEGDVSCYGQEEQTVASYGPTPFNMPTSPNGHCSKNDSFRDSLSLNSFPLQPGRQMAMYGPADVTYAGPNFCDISVNSSSSGLWNNGEDRSSSVTALKRQSLLGRKGHTASSPASKTSRGFIMRSSQCDEECRTQ